MQRELEVCAETLPAVEAANAGGADRIELCAALSEGGVTAGVGFLREAVAASKIPVHALIRPRSGGFVHSAAEFRMLCTDAEAAFSIGVAGIVVGVLTADYAIDIAQTKELMRVADGKPVTFHRAFDLTRDLHESLRVVMDLGCSRVLTSGGQPMVMDGLEMLRELTAIANGSIRIAAGGGVNLQNAAVVAQVPGLDLHGSFRRKPPAEDVRDVLWQKNEPWVEVEDVRAAVALLHGA
ncbi:MAG: copper homeostasis protein CutC [Terriglobus sp.]